MAINEREMRLLQNSGLKLVNGSNPLESSLRVISGMEHAKLSKTEPFQQITAEQIASYFEGGKRDIKSIPDFFKSKNKT